jgi:hypothetical protein
MMAPRKERDVAASSTVALRLAAAAFDLIFPSGVLR